MAQSDFSFVDMSSLFELTNLYSDRSGKSLRLNYKALAGVLKDARAVSGMRLVEDGYGYNLAYTAVDSKSEGQERFCRMLETSGFCVKAQNHLDLQVSGNPGSARNGQISMASTMAFSLAYSVAKNPTGHFQVVTHCAELALPVFTLAAANPEARIQVVYTSSDLNSGWSRTPLRTEGSKVDFFDLTPYLEILYEGYHSHKITAEDYEKFSSV